MYIQGLKIRYINYACYEIVLPNGKVIVVDPCIDIGFCDVAGKTQKDHPDVDGWTGDRSGHRTVSASFG